MVTLVAVCLILLVVEFLFAPFWTERDRSVYPQELLDRLNHDIENEIRALRSERDE